MGHDSGETEERIPVSGRRVLAPVLVVSPVECCYSASDTGTALAITRTSTS